MGKAIPGTPVLCHNTRPTRTLYCWSRRAKASVAASVSQGSLTSVCYEDRRGSNRVDVHSKDWNIMRYENCALSPGTQGWISLKHALLLSASVYQFDEQSCV